MNTNIYVKDEIPEAISKRVLPGDVICERGQSWISKAIRFCTRHRGEEATYSNHTAIVGTFNNVVEALSKVVSTQILEWPVPNEFELWRKTDLTRGASRAIALRAETHVGKFYGALKIIPHAIDGLLGKVFGRDIYLTRRLAFLPRYPICSWVVAESYYATLNYLFNSNWRYASPDCIHDHLRDNIGEWYLVLKLTKNGILVCYDTEGSAPSP